MLPPSVVSASSSTSTPSIRIEGRAKIAIPSGNQVFYNPVQILNRDLSVLAIKSFIDFRKELFISKSKSKSKQLVDLLKEGNSSVPDFPGVSILEALSASGLRSLRYATEIDDIKKLVINDIDPTAVANIKSNLTLNDIDKDPRIVPSLSDANLLMSQGEFYDIIDLDPYGTAAPFLDAAIKGIADNGMLAVTCTDSRILCGTLEDQLFNHYGVAMISTPMDHEISLRIILKLVQEIASRYSRNITPLLSFHSDFYYRMFIQVDDKRSQVMKAPTRLSMLKYCNSCSFWEMHPIALNKGTDINPKVKINRSFGSNLCEICQTNTGLYGPIYNGPLHDQSFVNRIRKYLEPENRPSYILSKRLSSLVNIIHTEIDAPLGYNINQITKRLKTEPLSLKKIASAVLNANHTISRTHTRPQVVKTNAPSRFLFDALISHYRTNNTESQMKKTIDRHFNGNSTSGIGHALEKMPLKSKIDFTIHKDAHLVTNRNPMLKFPEKPKNWGPKTKAQGRGNTVESVEMVDSVRTKTERSDSPESTTPPIAKKIKS